MTTRAALAAVVMVLTLVVPVVAGPFHELPPNHWVYDTLTELAIRGLIEGYPEGAFRGDRPITRHETAIIVSRVLARIDAVHVQAVSSHMARVERLVAEFRAELNALGIRAVRVEAELAHLRLSAAGAATFRRPDPREVARFTLASAGDSGAEYGLRLEVGNLTGESHLADPGDYDLRATVYDHAHAAFANGRGADLRHVRQQTLQWAPSDISTDWFAGAAKPVGGGVTPISSPGMSLSLSDRSLGEELSPVWALAAGAVGLTLAQHTDVAWRGLSRSHESQIPDAAADPAAEVGAARHAPDNDSQFHDGQRAFAGWATWSGIPSLAASPIAAAWAWRIGGTFDLSQWGIATWNSSLDVAHGIYPSGLVGASGLVPLSATTVTGQYQSWSTPGWLARLNLSFTSRTTGSIVYERGQVITTGQPYAEWALRMAHQMAPNTTLTLQYNRVRCGNVGGAPCPGFATAGEIDRMYRAELLYSW